MLWTCKAIYWATMSYTPTSVASMCCRLHYVAAQEVAKNHIVARCNMTQP